MAALRSQTWCLRNCVAICGVTCGDTLRKSPPDSPVKIRRPGNSGRNVETMVCLEPPSKTNCVRASSRRHVCMCELVLICVVVCMLRLTCAQMHGVGVLCVLRVGMPGKQTVFTPPFLQLRQSDRVATCFAVLFDERPEDLIVSHDRWLL